MPQKKTFDELKKKLPFQYARLISRNLIGISNVQVRLVFKGDITNPETVEKVKAEAINLKVLFEKNGAVVKKKKAAGR